MKRGMPRLRNSHAEWRIACATLLVVAVPALVGCYRPSGRLQPGGFDPVAVAFVHVGRGCNTGQRLCPDVGLKTSDGNVVVLVHFDDSRIVDGASGADLSGQVEMVQVASDPPILFFTRKFFMRDDISRALAGARELVVEVAGKRIGAVPFDGELADAVKQANRERARSVAAADEMKEFQSRQAARIREQEEASKAAEAARAAAREAERVRQAAERENNQRIESEFLERGLVVTSSGLSKKTTNEHHCSIGGREVPCNTPGAGDVYNHVDVISMEISVKNVSRFALGDVDCGLVVEANVGFFAPPSLTMVSCSESILANNVGELAPGARATVKCSRTWDGMLSHATSLAVCSASVLDGRNLGRGTYYFTNRTSGRGSGSISW